MFGICRLYVSAPVKKRNINGKRDFDTPLAGVRAYQKLIKFTTFRYYTKHFGDDEKAGRRMCCHAISNYKMWEKEIADWQEPILNDE